MEDMFYAIINVVIQLYTLNLQGLNTQVGVLVMIINVLNADISFTIKSIKNIMIAFWLIHAVFYLLTFWLGVKYNKVLQVNGKRNGIILTIFTLLFIIFITGLFNYYGLCNNLL